MRLLAFAAAVWLLGAQVLAQTVVTTILAAEPTQEPSFVSDQAFQDAVINSTNTYRSDYNASAVQWNDSLADFASDYVDDCNFAHSGGPYGENLAEGYLNATGSVEAWGNEASQYDFSAGEFGESTGHFTQLVWKATTSVGCGRKFCNGRNNVPGWYVVCEYFPRGNVIGNFTENVQSCTNSTACGSASSVLLNAWRTSGSSLSMRGLWWVVVTSFWVWL